MLLHCAIKLETVLSHFKTTFEGALQLGHVKTVKEILEKLQRNIRTKVDNFVEETKITVVIKTLFVFF